MTAGSPAVNLLSMTDLDTEASNKERRRMGLGFVLTAWVLLLVLLAWLASAWLDGGSSEVPEARVGVDGGAEVVIRRGRSGHYVTRGTINDVEVTFLLDTGATLVAIDERLAQRLGLKKGARVRLQTANGEVEGRRTLLASIDVGGLQKHAIPAVIQPGLGEQVLLGMSFLGRISFTHHGDTLVLRDTRGNI